MNPDRFSRLEQRIEQLVEGSFVRLFQGRLQPRDVATRLARAVEDNTVTDANGFAYAPTHYAVLLNADDFAAMQGQSPALSASLADTVVDLANRFGLRLESTPQVVVSTGEGVLPRTVSISASHADQARSTQVLQALPAQALSQVRRRYPSLVSQGRPPFLLDRTVTNIGRKKDNHLIIDDARVSRKHAQIRLRFGQYVLYDLGSTSGTLVNNHQIKETILAPGDVISIAGVMLVYVEDQTEAEEAHQSDTQERRLNPVSDDTPPADNELSSRPTHKPFAPRR